jgi:hypothetical protein
MREAPPLHKYPRTHHLEGSRLQPGDEDLQSFPFEVLRGKHLVVEEKMDGANAALSFAPDGELWLQSRGHHLTGGPRERHFDLFKRWAHAAAAALQPVLGDHQVLYGEWLFAKHTVFYDELPHYFMEFDILDTRSGLFLDTARRRALLGGLPVVPVRVLFEGELRSLRELRALLGRSAFIGADHLDRLRALCQERGLDAARAVEETDPSAEMEGLYVKVEEGGAVTGRYKLIRPSFLSAVLSSESHWLDRPIVPNGLVEGARVLP